MDSGRTNPTPTAEQLLAFADRQRIIAGMKRAVDDVADLEIPEGSRPMLVLEKTRHRPNHPTSDAQQQHDQSSGLIRGSDASPSTSDAMESPILHQLDPASAPIPSSPLQDASKLSSYAIEPAVPQPSSAADPPPATSDLRPLDSKPTSPPIAKPLPDLDLKSPNMQSMLQEALNKGRSEERREHQVKLEKICQEKDKAIHDQQMTMARYQKELMARRRRIEHLEQQANFSFPQHLSPPQGQNLSGQQILDAEARFSTQAQELAVAKGRNDLMMAGLNNWKVQYGLVLANLEKWKTAFNTKAGQLDSCQRRLDHSLLELRESKAEANQLAFEKSEENSSLKAATEELESKLNVLSFDYNTLDGLYTMLAKVAAERLADIETVKTCNEEMESNLEQVEDGKEEIDALTSKNNTLVKLHERLEKTIAGQAKEIQDLSKTNEELIRELRERDDEDERARQNPNESPSQAQINQQATEPGNLHTEVAINNAEADVELVRVMLERERIKSGEESSKMEDRMTATLAGLEETEGRRRQMLMDELEDKDAQLYDAKNQIKELSEKLLAASSSQPSQSPASAPESSHSPEPSPPSIQSPQPKLSASPVAGATSWFHLPRLPHLPATDAGRSFSLRRIIIMLFIFLLAFLIPYLQIISPRADDSNNSWQEVNEILPEEVGDMGSREGRMRWEVWALTNLERDKGIPSQEEGWRRTEEVGRIGGWNF